MLTRKAVSAGSFIAAISSRASASPSSSHHSSASHTGYEWAIAAPAGVESSSAAEQLIALGGGAAQDRVDEAARGSRPPGTARPAHPLLGELDRLVDRGVIGRLGEQQLVEAEPQRGERGSVDSAAAAPGERGDDVVGGRAPLDRSVGEPPRLRQLAAVERGAARRRCERAVGPGPVLERSAEDLVGERAAPA